MKKKTSKQSPDGADWLDANRHVFEALPGMKAYSLNNLAIVASTLQRWSAQLNEAVKQRLPEITQPDTRN